MYLPFGLCYVEVAILYCTSVCGVQEALTDAVINGMKFLYLLEVG